MRTTTAIYGLFISTLLASDIAAQTEVYRLTSANGYQGENKLIPLSDLDGDGVREFALSNSSKKVDGKAFAGSVEVRSGQTGALLYQYLGTVQFNYLGSAVAALGDVNADGIDDFAISDRRSNFFGNDAGGIRVYSGSNGALVYQRTGLYDNAVLGLELAGLPDLNGNGVPDFAAASQGFGGEGLVFYYDGATGTVYRTLKRSDLAPSFGSNGIVDLGDVNGDGISDQAISAHSATPLDPATGNPNMALEKAGVVDVVSGASGARLFTVNGPEANLGMGLQLVALGDVSGDGIGDFAAGSGGLDRVLVFSGLNGATLAIIPTATTDKFRTGDPIRSLGDLNGDGILDLIVAIPFHQPVPDTIPGRLAIYLGGNFSLLQTVEGETLDGLLGWNLGYLGTRADGARLVVVTSAGEPILQLLAFAPLPPPADDLPGEIDPSNPPAELSAKAKVRRNGNAVIEVTYGSDWTGCAIDIDLAVTQRALVQNNTTNISRLTGAGAGSTVKLLAKKIPTPNRKQRQRKLYGRIAGSCFAGHRIEHSFVMNFRQARTKRVTPRRVVRAIARGVEQTP